MRITVVLGIMRRQLLSQVYICVTDAHLCLMRFLFSYLEDTCKVNIAVSSPIATLLPSGSWVCCAGDAMHNPRYGLCTHLHKRHSMSDSAR